MAVRGAIAIVSASTDRRRFSCSVLTAADYLALEAVDRTDAMRLLARGRVSLIITDFQLPDGDWKDSLSATAEMAEPPLVIVIAPKADGGFWPEVLNLGGYDVLPEPPTSAEIRRAVDTAARTWDRNREPLLRRSAASASNAVFQGEGPAR